MLSDWWNKQKNIRLFSFLLASLTALDVDALVDHCWYGLCSNVYVFIPVLSEIVCLLSGGTLEKGFIFRIWPARILHWDLLFHVSFVAFISCWNNFLLREKQKMNIKINVQVIILSNKSFVIWFFLLGSSLFYSWTWTYFLSRLCSTAFLTLRRST